MPVPNVAVAERFGPEQSRVMREYAIRMTQEGADALGPALLHLYAVAQQLASNPTDTVTFLEPGLVTFGEDGQLEAPTTVDLSHQPARIKLGRQFAGTALAAMTTEADSTLDPTDLSVTAIMAHPELSPHDIVRFALLNPARPFLLFSALHRAARAKEFEVPYGVNGWKYDIAPQHHAALGELILGSGRVATRLKQTPTTAGPSTAPTP